MWRRIALKAFWPLCLLLAFLIALFAIVEPSNTFRDCIDNAKYQKQQESFPKNSAPVSVTFFMRERCWGDFANQNANAIIALFTVALAGSTIGLWIVTGVAARAAKIAADHIPTVEGAFVYMLLKGDTFAAELKMVPGEKPENRFPKVYVTLKNFGKTPAIIESGSARFRYISAGISRDGQSVPLLPNAVVGAGEERPPKPPIQIEIDLTEQEARYVTENKAKVVLFGSLIYSDIWNVEWTIDFDGRYEPSVGFRLDNRRRKKNA